MPTQEPTRTETLADAGNSFGATSYGGRNVYFNNKPTPGRGPRTMSKVKSGVRKEAKNMDVHRRLAVPQVQHAGDCEIDSLADTCCLGLNFVPICFTGKVCGVLPFVGDLPSHQDVPICTAATAVDDKNGSTCILIVNEALWFGDTMKYSLINPNQVRANGISLCDDPTDPYWHLGMILQRTFIPFVMAGSACMFTTRTPTDWELGNCPHFEITSNVKWNPNQVHFRQIPGDMHGDGFIKRKDLVHNVKGRVLKSLE